METTSTKAFGTESADAPLKGLSIERRVVIVDKMYKVS
jgi:hypothetical protein